jgi:hypothetical protein
VVFINLLTEINLKGLFIRTKQIKNKKMYNITVQQHLVTTILLQAFLMSKEIDWMGDISMKMEMNLQVPSIKMETI